MWRTGPVPTCRGPVPVCGGPGRYQIYGDRTARKEPSGHTRPKTGSGLVNNWSTIGPQLGNNWSTIGQQLGNHRARIGQQLVSNWSTIGLQVGQNWSRLGQQFGNNWSRLGQLCKNCITKKTNSYQKSKNSKFHEFSIFFLNFDPNLGPLGGSPGA